MTLIVNTLISSVVQAAAFALIPFIVWLTGNRKKVAFFEYVGLKLPKLKTKWWVLVLFLAAYVVIYSADTTFMTSQEVLESLNGNSEVATSPYAGLRWAAVVPALIMTFIQNGLCEELFFRGFVCKRLIKYCGTPAGIILQAVIFALIHNIMFISVVPDLMFHLTIFAVISLMASIMGIINEKVFNGSIIPTIILHGLGNFISTMLIAFNIR